MLACSVNTNRFDLVFLGGKGVNAFIFGRSVGIDDFLDLGGADGFENVERAGDVVADSFERLFEAFDERRFGGKMEAAVSAFKEREDAGLANVGAMEFDALVDVVERAGGQIVDANDRVALIEEILREITADKSGDAGYDDAFWHGQRNRLPTRSGGRSRSTIAL